jgi:Domain of unknown function (DUF4286)
MYILNITYVVAENKVNEWKSWLKGEAFSKSMTFQNPSFQLYKINHREEGQVSFSVQFDFENLALLDSFEKELDAIHTKSLGPLLGPQCLFFKTLLSRELI